MEEIIKIFQNYSEESDANRERAILGAIKILVKLNDDEQNLTRQINEANRETRRKYKGLMNTKHIIRDYIKLVETVLVEGGVDENGDKSSHYKSGEGSSSDNNGEG